jgi:hypothetical protein
MKGGRSDGPGVSLPVPGRGFCARAASGQKVKKAPLPNPKKGDQIVVIDGAGPPVTPELPPPEVLAQIEFERRPENLISVSEDVVRYHPLVRAARESLAPRKQDHKRGLVSSGLGTLHIRVSPASKVRALRILDALVKACEIRGFEVRSSEVRASGASAQDAETVIQGAWRGYAARARRTLGESLSRMNGGLFPRMRLRRRLCGLMCRTAATCAGVSSFRVREYPGLKRSMYWQRHLGRRRLSSPHAGDYEPGRSTKFWRPFGSFLPPLPVPCPSLRMRGTCPRAPVPLDST